MSLMVIAMPKLPILIVTFEYADADGGRFVGGAAWPPYTARRAIDPMGFLCMFTFFLILLVCFPRVEMWMGRPKKLVPTKNKKRETRKPKRKEIKTRNSISRREQSTKTRKRKQKNTRAEQKTQRPTGKIPYDQQEIARGARA